MLNSTGVMAQDTMIEKLGEERASNLESKEFERSEAAEVYTQNFVDEVLEEVTRILPEGGHYLVLNHLGFERGAQNILIHKESGNLVLDDLNEDYVEKRDLRWLENGKVEVPEELQPQEYTR